jgi:hypothetical protein
MVAATIPFAGGVRASPHRPFGDTPPRVAVRGWRQSRTGTPRPHRRFDRTAHRADAADSRRFGCDRVSIGAGGWPVALATARDAWRRDRIARSRALVRECPARARNVRGGMQRASSASAADASSSRAALSMYGAATDASGAAASKRGVAAAALAAAGSGLGRTGGGSGAVGECSRFAATGSRRHTAQPKRTGRAPACPGPHRGRTHRHRPRHRSHPARNDWHAPRLSTA